MHGQAVFCLINSAKKTLSILHAGKAVCLLIPKNSLRSFCGMGESNSQPQFGKLMLYHLTNPARPEHGIGVVFYSSPPARHRYAALRRCGQAASATGSARIRIRIKFMIRVFSCFFFCFLFFFVCHIFKNFQTTSDVVWC